MNLFWHQFLDQLVATSMLEWIAVLLAIAYLLLAIKESFWCWPAAFFSTAIYSYLFFNVSLFMESFLNAYYLLMAVYGWQQWRATTSTARPKRISTWHWLIHFRIVIVTLIIVVLSSFLLQKYTSQDFALVDSLTTWFAIIATYMVTQKILENWLYWIIIDMVSIYLFVSKGFALTAVLFLSYIILAVVGWLRWKRIYDNHKSQNDLRKHLGESPC